jgi:hypothetical protein
MEVVERRSFLPANIVLNKMVYSKLVVHVTNSATSSPYSIQVSIGDDILMKSSNVKININNVCNLISVSSEQFN